MTTITFTGQTGNFQVDYIIQLVLDDTGRLDKVEDIKRRIQRAVMKHHFKDFYKKDLVDQIYVFLQTDSQQVIDTTLLDRFRSLSYVKKYMTVDSNGNPITPTTENGDIEEIAPELNTDGYGFNQTDVMYRAGTDIKIHSSTPIDQVFIGYYTFPNIEPIETLQSWIAAEYPSLIAATVKSRLFMNNGKEEEARLSKLEEAEELLVLQTNNIRLKVM